MWWTEMRIRDGRAIMKTTSGFASIFGRGEVISREVKLDWETAAGKDYVIEVSDNAKDWKTVKSIKDNSQTGWLDYPALQAQGRYVRINLQNARHGVWFFTLGIPGVPGS